MDRKTEIDALSKQIIAFQQGLNNVLDIFTESAKPEEKAFFKRKLPGNAIAIEHWSADCESCTFVTKLEKVGDIYELEGHIVVPPRAEIQSPNVNALSTRIAKNLILHVGPEWNIPYIPVEGDATKKVIINPLYRTITLRVFVDVDLT